MSERSRFVAKSCYLCSAKELYEWHSREGALERLIPLWERTSVVAKEGGIEKGGKVTMKMHAGPFPFTWNARHVENNPGVMFRDVQQSGPFSYWSHSHKFHDTEEGGVLEDQIDYQLPLHSYLPGFIKKQMESTLQRIFLHRHEKLRQDLLLHRRCSSNSLSILITGASGVLGKALIPLLTTGGHRVWTLVRRKPDPAKNEIFWDPVKGEIDKDALPQLDGVVHLAGEYIGLGRWTDEKKKTILESRTKGTHLLASTLAAMAKPPGVFLCASAVGYYGDCGDRLIGEEKGSGDDFISEVCRKWEEAAQPAKDGGIRTLFMRIGVVLTPQGGALQRFINSSYLGCISRIGQGKQYISWLSIDDMVAAILHALVCRELSGPVNMAAPEPVSNLDFMKILARLLKRPLMPTIPVFVLKTIYGQMASEILLSGCRVSCKKLEASGFRFRHATLETALRCMLGKK